MVEEQLNRFLNEKVAIALRTQEEWDKFMELLESETDVKWKSGSKPTKFQDWGGRRQNSCVCCKIGISGFMGFASCEFYRESGYEIIEFKELIKEEINYGWNYYNYKKGQI